MNIVLAGMPGSGKTTVAKALERTGKKVIDTDEVIVGKYGRISDIFAEHGEEYFRDLETCTVMEASGLSDVVIATGGGCLLRGRNVELFKRSGKIIFLRTRPETLIKRVEGDTERPLLQGNMRDRILSLYNARTPVYERAADIVIDTDELLPEEIAERILELTK